MSPVRKRTVSVPPLLAVVLSLAMLALVSFVLFWTSESFEEHSVPKPADTESNPTDVHADPSEKPHTHGELNGSEPKEAVFSIYEQDAFEHVAARGDQCFCIMGKVMMKNGGPLPPGLKVTCLPKEPPFASVSIQKKNNSESTAFTESGDLFDALTQPNALISRNGLLFLKGVENRRLFLFPVHPYYRAARELPQQPVPLEKIEKGEIAGKVVLILEEAGVIEGRVLEPDGGPARSTTLTLKEEFSAFSVFSARKGIVTPFTVETSENGTFRFEQVPVGLIMILEAGLSGFAPVKKEHLVARAGKSTRIELTLPIPSSICGMVKNRAGEGAPSVKVVLGESAISFSSPQGVKPKESLTDRDGRFEFSDLPEGKYTLKLLESGYLRKSLSGITVLPGETIDDIVLVLDEGLAISGTISDQAAEPIPLADITATRSLNLGNIGESITDMQNPIEARADESGRFEIKGLDSSAYDLKINAEGFAPSEKNNIKAGKEELYVVLPKGGVLKGIAFSAVDGGAVKDYTIRLKNRTAQGRSYLDPMGLKSETKHTVRDEKGKFSITDLSPGSYKLTFKADEHGKLTINNIEVESGKTVYGIIAAMPGECVISGTVVDFLTREPIEGAMVSRKAGLEGILRGFMDDDAAFSDSSGCFRMGGLAAGSVRLIVTHARYKDLPLEEVTLLEGEKREGLELLMSRGSAIEGLVSGPDRQPLFGVHILVTNMTGTKIKSARTDGDGNYIVQGLSKGSYAVTKMPDSFSFDPDNSASAWISSIQSQSIVLGEDEIRECDFTAGLFEEIGCELTGVVRENSLPVSGVVISLLPAGPKEGKALKPKTSSCNKRGEYGFKGVVPGQYTLRFVKMGDISLGAANEIVFELEVPDLVSFRYDVDLPGGSISGTARDEEDHSLLDSIRIVLEKNDTDGSVDSFTHAKGNRVAEIYTNPDGRFKLCNLREGSYRIRAGGGNIFGMNPGGYGIRTVDDLDIAEDEHMDGLVIDLKKGGDLEGHVMDFSGYPVAGASLYIQPAGSTELESYSECITDGTGLYSYKGLTPGNCTVVVKHPDFALKACYGVRIEKEEVTTLNMTLDEGCAVYVRVTGKEPGELLAGAHVEFKDEAGHDLYGLMSMVDIMSNFFGENVNDGQGVFIGMFSCGTYHLNVSHPEYGWKAVTVEISPNETTRLLTVDL